jgi:hypothetical protein
MGVTGQHRHAMPIDATVNAAVSIRPRAQVALNPSPATILDEQAVVTKYGAPAHKVVVYHYEMSYF